MCKDNAHITHVRACQFAVGVSHQFIVFFFLGVSFVYVCVRARLQRTTVDVVDGLVVVVVVSHCGPVLPDITVGGPCLVGSRILGTVPGEHAQIIYNKCDHLAERPVD